MMPRRIQLSRKKGWRKPPNTVVVSRPSKWGNPFDWKIFGKAKASEMYRNWLSPYEVSADDRRQWILDHLPELRGKNLACWCKPGEPCHADVLLALANEADDG